MMVRLLAKNPTRATVILAHSADDRGRFAGA
jgi:hypothetical protein